MTVLALIALWLLVSVIAGLLIGRGVRALGGGAIAIAPEPGGPTEPQIMGSDHLTGTASPPVSFAVLGPTVSAAPQGVSSPGLT